MPVKVLTDHKGLEYFMTTKKLTPRQTRWAEFLSEFNFKVTYQTGKKNNKADALTRRLNERPINDKDKRQEHRMQVLLPPERIKIQPMKVEHEDTKAENAEEEVTDHAKATRDEGVEIDHDEPKKKSKKAEELGRSHAAEPHAEDEKVDESVVATRDKKMKLKRKEGVEAEHREVELEDLPTLPDRVKEANRRDALFTEVCKYLANPVEHDRPTVYLRGSRAENGLLYKDNKLWVAKNLRLDVIREVHDQPAVGHADVRRTMLLIQQHFFWPRMKRDVDRYIRNCHICRRAKAPRDRYNGTLKPLPVPERPWTNITMDFVTGLPECELKNAILMVVDRLAKERVYIPCSDKDEGTNAEATAKMLLHNVWRRHGLPSSVVSDRGPQFVSSVWKALCKLLQINAKLSTAFHPETDGQSEIANQEMERHLRTYVNHFQNNWVDLLPIAEFAANANPSSTTKIPPFQATRGYVPRMSFDPVDLSEELTREQLANTKAWSIASDMEEVWKFVREEMARSQEKYTEAADRYRKSVEYKVGDSVWLSTKNIKTERPSKKLDHKMVGPFKIKALVGSLCRLELPTSMKIHDVFHPSLLRKASADPLPGQHNDPAPPVIVDDKEEWEVNDILDARKRGRKVQFRVKWKRYDKDKTWYDASGFEHSRKLVDDFYHRNPTKPRQD